jgi:hypothetical protein
MQANIFGIFLAELIDLKKAAEFHAENDGRKRLESATANQ